MPDDAPRVVLETSLGDITLGLYPDRAPVTVDNFLSYVDDGHYDGTMFHRVMQGFMIQGGGFTPDRQHKETRAPIVNEAIDSGLGNVRGTVAMARTGQPDSATAQFFVNLVDNRQLDPGGADAHGYAVFGVVVDGMGVVDRIAAVEIVRGTGNWQAVPAEPVVIESARRVEGAAGS